MAEPDTKAELEDALLMNGVMLQSLDPTTNEYTTEKARLEHMRFDLQKQLASMASPPTTPGPAFVAAGLPADAFSPRKRPGDVTSASGSKLVRTRENSDVSGATTPESTTSFEGFEDLRQRRSQPRPNPPGHSFVQPQNSSSSAATRSYAFGQQSPLGSHQRSSSGLANSGGPFDKYQSQSASPFLIPGGPSGSASTNPTPNVPRTNVPQNVDVIEISSDDSADEDVRMIDRQAAVIPNHALALPSRPQMNHRADPFAELDNYYVGQQHLHDGPTHGQYCLQPTAPSIFSAIGDRIMSGLDGLSNLISGPSYTRPGALDPLTIIDPDAYWRNRGGGDDDDDFFEGVGNASQEEVQRQIQQLLENIDESVSNADDREQTPHQLNVELKEHQKIGLKWLKKMEAGSNKGGILADDMGLGKTIQALALMLNRPSEDPANKTTLIVAPLALLKQWKAEMETKIKPQHRLSIYTYWGQNRKSDYQFLRRHDVVLTTYGNLAMELKKKDEWMRVIAANPDARMRPKDRFPLVERNSTWYRIILDEAHFIKNRSTTTARAAFELNASSKFCMTGTPMMNNVDELFSLIHFIGIAPYNDWKKFRLDIGNPIRRKSQNAMTKLQAVWKAIALRRLKTSKIDGEPIIVLPPITDARINAVFSKDEAELYRGLETKTQIKFNKYLKAKTVMKNYAHVLVLLLRLRQACCHPHLITDLSVEIDAKPEEMEEFAAQFSVEVVNRIRDNEAFTCPVCLDAIPAPIFAFPCGHETCGECFTRITETSAGEDGPPRCPQCRSDIHSKKAVDWKSFCRVHAPERLGDDELSSDGAADSESDSDSESDELADEDESLGGFIVADDAEDDDEGDEDSRRGSDAVDVDENGDTSSSANHKRGKSKEKSKREGKGKGKAKPKTTLAQLKKESLKNKAAKRRYLKRLRKRFEPSAKINKAMEILLDIREADPLEKTIVFSQWTSFLDLIEIPISTNGYNYERYDGGMSAEARDEAIINFMNSPTCNILLISLKAGNAGLNLHAASQVIIMDNFWHPFLESQAIGRAHRFPNSRPVTVHRLHIEETVEERILSLQQQKQELIEQAMDENGQSSMTRLGLRELGYLFGITNNQHEDPEAA